MIIKIIIGNFFLNMFVGLSTEDCAGLFGDENCCRNIGNGCSEGQGDCDNNGECEFGLICGVNNCRDYNTSADPNADCCTPKPECDGSYGTAHCCVIAASDTGAQKCSVGQGDCDMDFQCEDGLLCGKNNCQEFNPNAEPGHDCCYIPTSPLNPDCDGSKDSKNCCTVESPCHLGQGDCDSDDECQSGLTCGKNNCYRFNPDAHEKSDCCFSCSSWDGCCSEDDQCREGEGVCSNDDQCEDNLICGKRNCQDFDPTARKRDNCCTKRICDGGRKARNCCTPESPCHISEGDCDNDDDCQAGLVCGKNNCISEFGHSGAKPRSDCCTTP